MAEDNNQQYNEQKAKHHSPEQIEMLRGEHPHDPAVQTYPQSLLGDPRLNSRGNAPVHNALMQQMQRTHGDRSLQRVLHREHAGKSAAIPVQRSPIGPGQSPYPSSRSVPVQRFGFDDVLEGLGNSGRPLEFPSDGFQKLSDFGFSGPTGSLKENQFGGLEGEGQLAGRKSSVGGVPIVQTGGGVEVKRGIFNDGNGIRVGEKGSIAGGKATFNEGGVFSGDVGVGTASVEGTAGSSGVSVGAQANIAEFSGTASSIGKTEGGSNTEESIRVGLSEGVGLAGRLHFGDADKDKHREFGFGFDAGPLSVDVKSEDPLSTSLKIMGAAQGGLGSMSGLGNSLISAAMPEQKQANLTDELFGGLTGGQDFNKELDKSVASAGGGAKSLFEGLGISTNPKDLSALENNVADATLRSTSPLGGVSSLLQGAGSLAGSAAEELGGFNPLDLF